MNSDFFLFFSNPASRRVLRFGVQLTLASLLWVGVSPVFAASENPTTRPAPRLNGRPDQARGRELLAGFSQASLPGTYWLAFELRVMPRQGADRVVPGMMWGTPGAETSRALVALREKPGHEERCLLPGLVDAPLTRWSEGGQPHPLTKAEELLPLLDTDLTPFDLRMPFLRWSDFVYEGQTKVRARPSHSFILYPPVPFTPPREGVPVPAAIRIALDVQFGALTQVDWLDANGDRLKTLTVLDLKKIGERWIIKSIDLRNRDTNTKTRFSVTAAALDLTLPDEVFAPENLGQPTPVIPREEMKEL